MIYTIGYGNKSIEEFIVKLKENGIKMLIDVRTRPFSRWNRKFSQSSLELVLAKHSIRYLFKGNNLGGLGENVDFEATIDEMASLSSIVGICVMCSEGQPEKCHRFTMLAPAFERCGTEVKHLRWDKAENLRLL